MSYPLDGYRVLVACAVLLGSVTTTSETQAAPPSSGQMSAEALIAKIDGQLINANRKGVTVKDKEGTEYTVMYPDIGTSTILTGKAIPAFLRKGMLIRTRVNFNAQGQPMSAAKKIEVFSPVAAAMVPHNQINQSKPGVNPIDRKLKVGMPGEYFVIGQLGNFNGSMMAVQAGQVPLRLPVDPDGKIEVKVHDLSMALEGDRVVVEGFYEPAKPTLIKAKSIRVMPTRVFGEKPEKPARSKKSKSKKPDAAERATK